MSLIGRVVSLIGKVIAVSGKEPVGPVWYQHTHLQHGHTGNALSALCTSMYCATLPVETISCLSRPQEDPQPYVIVMFNQVCMNTGPLVPL